jgi:uncharacterized RDD family membrane protein YckC
MEINTHTPANETGNEYAGFWLRVGATIIDSILTACFTLPAVVAVYGWEYFETEGTILGPADFIITWIIPMVAILAFWIKKQATPGKMALSLRIVDAATGRPAQPTQLIGRYLAYFISALPLGLGFLWVAFDKHKQGWHDKLSGTVVLRKLPARSKLATFNNNNHN